MSACKSICAHTLLMTASGINHSSLSSSIWNHGVNVLGPLATDARFSHMTMHWDACEHACQAKARLASARHPRTPRSAYIGRIGCIHVVIPGGASAGCGRDCRLCPKCIAQDVPDHLDGPHCDERVWLPTQSVPATQLTVSTVSCMRGTHGSSTLSRLAAMYGVPWMPCTVRRSAIVTAWLISSMIYTGEPQAVLA